MLHDESPRGSNGSAGEDSLDWAEDVDRPGATGPRVLVTGATGGLGRTVTAVLVNAGYQVIAVDLSKYQLDRLEERVDASERLSCYTADLSSAEDVRILFARIQEEKGALDGVVHLVGGYHGGTSIDETTDEVFDHMVDLNLRSSFLVTREAVRWLRPRGGGSIVLISSAAAIPGTGAAGASVYAATKAGVSALAEAVAAENRTWGVRVNALLPTMIRTQANVDAMPNAEHHRWVTPEELAETIRFLVSPAASGITGALIKASARL